MTYNLIATIGKNSVFHFVADGTQNEMEDLKLHYENAVKNVDIEKRAKYMVLRNDDK